MLNLFLAGKQKEMQEDGQGEIYKNKQIERQIVNDKGIQIENSLKERLKDSNSKINMNNNRQIEKMHIERKTGRVSICMYVYCLQKGIYIQIRYRQIDKVQIDR